MTRYNDEPSMSPEHAALIDGYCEGVDRVLEYVESVYPAMPGR